MMSFDPSAPFVASTGLRYADFGEWMAGRPECSYRNQCVQTMRAEGATDEYVQKWIERYEHRRFVSGPDVARLFARAVKSALPASIFRSERTIQSP